MKKLVFVLFAVMLLGTQSVFAEERLSGGDPAYVPTFEELTGLSREDIDHIVIKSGAEDTGYSTGDDKIISDIYNTINTKNFKVYVSEGSGDGQSYEIVFFSDDNLNYSYTLGKGIKSRSGVPYKKSDEEELSSVITEAYNLIANDCSDWSADDIVWAKDSEFLGGITDISYKEPITTFTPSTYQCTTSLRWQYERFFLKIRFVAPF